MLSPPVESFSLCRWRFKQIVRAPHQLLGIEHKTRMCYNQGQLGWQVGGITKLISPVGGEFGYAFVIYTSRNFGAIVQADKCRRVVREAVITNSGWSRINNPSQSHIKLKAPWPRGLYPGSGGYDTQSGLSNHILAYGRRLVKGDVFVLNTSRHRSRSKWKEYI